MCFINGRLSLVGMALLLLAACSSAPQQPADQTTQTNSVAEASTAPAPAAKIPSGATQAYEKVLAAIDTQQWQTAEVLLQEMQADYPRLLALRASLGWVYWQSGQVDFAIKELEDVINKPRLAQADAHNTLAIIYREQGDFAKAEALYKEAIQRWPDNAILHRNVGVLYELYFGRLKDALAHYQQAQQLAEQQDKRLGRWVKDLQRRTQSKQKGS